MFVETALLVLSLTFGFLMACAVGANDVANAMGTSVGSKVLTIFQAIVLASIFEAMGAFLASSQVTQTIQKGVVDLTLMDGKTVISGMLASLLSSGLWLILATARGWPVSTTHSIIGAIIGFALIAVGYNAIHWMMVWHIALSWIITPIIAGCVAFLLFKSMQKGVMQASDPLGKARHILPFYVFLVGFVIGLISLHSVLHMLNLHPSEVWFWCLSLLLGVGFSIVSLLMLHHLHFKQKTKNRSTRYRQVEKVFGLLVIFTAAAMAFAHGSNDVANAIAPLSTLIYVIKNGSVQGLMGYSTPFWIFGLGALGVLVGLATYGHRVIETVGDKITYLDSSRGFCAQLATALTVLLSSSAGLPVSTTQILVGGIMGVGLAGGVQAIDLNVVRGIFMSWVVTVPAGAFFSIVFYSIFRLFF
jgi:inorganic phosphate transporter, PiT family